MQNALLITTRVLPVGWIQNVDKDLPVGESVSVVVIHATKSEQRFAVDILKEAPGQHLFEVAKVVESYLRDELVYGDR